MILRATGSCAVASSSWVTHHCAHASRSSSTPLSPKICRCHGRGHLGRTLRAPHQHSDSTEVAEVDEARGAGEAAWAPAKVVEGGSRRWALLLRQALRLLLLRRPSSAPGCRESCLSSSDLESLARRPIESRDSRGICAPAGPVQQQPQNGMSPDHLEILPNARKVWKMFDCFTLLIRNRILPPGRQSIGKDTRFILACGH